MMRRRELFLFLGALLLSAVVAVIFMRFPELRGRLAEDLETPDVSEQAAQERNTEAAPTQPPAPGGETVEPQKPQCDASRMEEARLGPIAEFARYIAEQHRTWRLHGGNFLPAKELAALYGLEVYALPANQRPPSPGVTPVALKLGYFVVAPRFVETLVEQGERLRPIREHDLKESESKNETQEQSASPESAWTQDLLQQTAQKARQLAACQEGERKQGDECRFARAFITGLAGPEGSAEQLQAEAAGLLLDLANRLEAKVAETREGEIVAQPPVQ